MSGSTLIGEILGNYRVEAVLGTGGMGRVYQGVHIHLGRAAAIKVMHPQHAADPRFQARFLQEARAAAELRHPNIIEVYDFGVQDELFYLVMELATDGSLRSLLRGERPADIPATLAGGIDLIRQAADGLGYAHRRGMVHRDVKPDNLLLAHMPEGDDPSRIKIADFGLARLAEGNVTTLSGVAMGTPAYVSPEQCRGEPVDGRSDIYSLGVVLYEVSTGELPFQSLNLTDAVFKHVYTDPRPPRHARSDLPPNLEEIILRCLAKQPEQRFVTMERLSSELERVQAEAAGIAFRSTAAATPTVVTVPVAALTLPVLGPSVITESTPHPIAGTAAPMRDLPERSTRYRPLAVAGLLAVFALAALGLGSVFGAFGDDDTAPGTVPAPESGSTPLGVITGPATQTETRAATAETPNANLRAPVPSPTATTPPPPTSTTLPASTTTPQPPPPTATEMATQPEPTIANPEPTPTEPAPTQPAQASSGSELVDGFTPRGKPAVELNDKDFTGYYDRKGACYTKKSMLLYGQNSGADAASATFTTDAEGEGVYIVITGLDDEIDQHESLRVILNGQTIWEGALPFANSPQPGDCKGKADWRTATLKLVDRSLLGADNELQVQNIEPDGSVGRPPWVLLNSVAIYVE